MTYVSRKHPATAEDDEDEDEGPAEQQEAMPHWPEGWRPPPSLVDATRGPTSERELENVLRYALFTLMREDRGPRPLVEAEMDALCPRRAEADVEAYQRAWDQTTGRRPPKP